MSVSRSRAVPKLGEHPDHDLLADLAAEVLSGELAQRVQIHVMSCAYCAGLLAEAEGIRSLLRQSEPEPMPNAVLFRLERALAEASQPGATANPATRPGGFPVVGATGGFPTRGANPGTPARGTNPNAPARGANPGTPARGETSGFPFPGAAPAAPARGDTSGFPFPGAAPAAPARGDTSGFPLPGEPTGATPTGGNRGRRITRSQPPVASPETGPMTTLLRPVGGAGPAGSGSEGQPSSRLSRMSRPTQRARRQSLEEQKADRPSRVRPVLKIAAAAVVVLGAGALTLHLTQGGSSDNTASGSSAGAPSPGALLAPIQSTDTNYARSALKKQIATLISSSQQQNLSASGKSQPDAATVAPHGTARAGVQPGATAATGPQLLRSPGALQACLKQIGAEQQPVAVDLARYAGQEAAIIVLPGPAGGYEVEVVARDCRAGNDGTIDVVNLSAP